MMNLPDVPLLSMLRERMTWLNQRQDVLSQNVANADTPGYVARDLKPLDFEQALSQANSGAAMMTTNARHITLSPSRSGKFEDHETPDQESNPNGNAVSLEMEMIKVSETQAQFAAAANLYAKAMTLMKTAIGH
ncbi:MAG TPA: flagellar basal body rod protein FlgB [Rhizomicrobium sp.]|nr:flagellar basal body rod protein FlgB [Rhizomicrobium sp.]